MVAAVTRLHPSRQHRGTPFDQTSIPSDGLFRIDELHMCISAAISAAITADKKTGESFRQRWSCLQLPAGCLSVPPSEMIFMRVRAHRVSGPGFVRIWTQRFSVLTFSPCVCLLVSVCAEAYDESVCKRAPMSMLQPVARYHIFFIYFYLPRYNVWLPAC